MHPIRSADFWSYKSSGVLSGARRDILLSFLQQSFKWSSVQVICLMREGGKLPMLGADGARRDSGQWCMMSMILEGVTTE